MISNSSNKILEFEAKFYIYHFTWEQNLKNINNLGDKLAKGMKSL